MQGNLRSLRILFISICVLYTLRMAKFVLLITTDMTIADSLDPYILVAKTLMIFGLLLSIYLRIESTSGNLHTEVVILTTTNDFKNLLSSDGYEINSITRPNSQFFLRNPSLHLAPNASIFKHQHINADVSTVIQQRTNNKTA
jgi:hypothetical protein